MVKFVATVKAVVTRLVFAAHGLLAIWQAVARRKEPLLWYLSVPIILLFFEGLFTLTVKRNQEWKWFCPSVFLYLGSVVPSIWLLELDKLDKRLLQLSSMGESVQPQAHTGEPSAILPDTQGGGMDSKGILEGGGEDGGGDSVTVTTVMDQSTQGEDITKDLDKILTQLHLPPSLSRAIPSELWVTLLEQSLMLALILGRWLLPKGELTREQLSQLLLVYIGTAADIIEFLDSFKEDRVARQPILVTLTLSIWAWSLLQFTLVLTATKARRSRMSSSAVVTTSSPRTSAAYGKKSDDVCCCSVDAWAIVINMVLQDAPFVAFRLLLIIHFRIVSYLNVFFACKNTLVILLQLYRLYVVQMERRKQTRRRRGRVKTHSKNSRHDKRHGPLSEGVAVVGGPELYRFGRGLNLQRRRSGPEDSEAEDSDNMADELRSVRSSPCAAARNNSKSPTRYKDRRKSLSAGNLKEPGECSDDASDHLGLEEVVTLKELKEIRRRARQDLLLLLAAEPVLRRNKRSGKAPELEVE